MVLIDAYTPSSLYHLTDTSDGRESPSPLWVSMCTADFQHDCASSSPAYSLRMCKSNKINRNNQFSDGFIVWVKDEISNIGDTMRGKTSARTTPYRTHQRALNSRPVHFSLRAMTIASTAFLSTFDANGTEGLRSNVASAGCSWASTNSGLR